VFFDLIRSDLTLTTLPGPGHDGIGRHVFNHHRAAAITEPRPLWTPEKHNRTEPNPHVVFDERCPADRSVGPQTSFVR